jgi:hypothetical protein
MGPEGYSSVPETPAASEQERDEDLLTEQADLSTFLGEGFDAEYFTDKTMAFPHDSLYAEWNAFLVSEGGELIERTIEHGVLEGFLSKLTGAHNDAPLMYPVFIQGLQQYYGSQGMSHDHVTPERMQRFYDTMVGRGAEQPA